MSELEDNLDKQIFEAGLAAPQREYTFHPSRKWRLDFAWPDVKLGLEVQGGTFVTGAHSRGKSMQNDMEKLNAAQNWGWRILQVDTEMIRDGRALEIVRGSLLLPLYSWKPLFT